MGRNRLEAAMSETPEHDDSDGQADTASSQHRTYAVVVGIERYDAGGDWDLEGPAEDVIRFTSWLTARGVPDDHILVFLSPLDGAPSAATLPSGVIVRPARREYVYEAITRTLPDWEGDLLWVFWSGHGVLTRDDHLRLLYADATTEDKLNLDAHSLLTALRSDRYARLSRMAGVFDACQIYAERLQFGSTMPAETLPYGLPLSHAEQFVLYAASPGEIAANQGRAQGGLFSRMVLEELTGSGDGWPPNMDLVAARLVQRFTELRAGGRAEQTPTQFRWRPWTGGEQILSDPEPAPAGAAGTSADSGPRAALSVQSALDRLRDLLVTSTTEDEAKRIVLGSGATTSEAWWSRSPTSFWDTALAEAHRAWRMDDLFARADMVFGANPEWRDAKAQYLEARDASRRYLVAPPAPPVHPYHEHLQATSQALCRIVPRIFRDPRISTEALDAASAALGSLRPLIEAITTRASQETRPSARFELQRLGGRLRRHRAEVSRELTDLRQISSESAAEPLCHALAEDRVALLSVAAEAVRRVT
jgi:Caspase domain